MALPAGDDLFSRFVTMPACDGQTNVRLSAANSIELLLQRKYATLVSSCWSTTVFACTILLMARRLLYSFHTVKVESMLYGVVDWIYKPVMTNKQYNQTSDEHSFSSSQKSNESRRLTTDADHPAAAYHFRVKGYRSSVTPLGVFKCLRFHFQSGCRCPLDASSGNGADWTRRLTFFTVPPTSQAASQSQRYIVQVVSIIGVQIARPPRCRQCQQARIIAFPYIRHRTT